MRSQDRLGPLAGKVVIIVPDKNAAGEVYVEVVGSCSPACGALRSSRSSGFPCRTTRTSSSGWTACPKCGNPVYGKRALEELAIAAEIWEPAM